VGTTAASESPAVAAAGVPRLVLTLAMPGTAVAFGTPPTPPTLRARATVEGTAAGGNIAVRFPELRGGEVRLRVTATVRGTPLEAELTGVTLVGTNPTYAQLTEALGPGLLRNLVWHESRGRQFDGPADGGVGRCPLYSRDGLGGAGLGQITRPAPTPDQMWDYNGYAGNDGFVTPRQLHEFRVAVRRDQTGERLEVREHPNGRTGEAVWERVPVRDRPRSGDPNYVEHVVRAAPPF